MNFYLTSNLDQWGGHRHCCFCPLFLAGYKIHLEGKHVRKRQGFTWIVDVLIKFSPSKRTALYNDRAVYYWARPLVTDRGTASTHVVSRK